MERKLISNLFEKPKEHTIVHKVDGRIKYIVRREDSVLGRLAVINDFLLNRSIEHLEAGGHSVEFDQPNSANEEFIQCALTLSEKLYFPVRQCVGGWKSEYHSNPASHEGHVLGFKLLILGAIRRLVLEEGHNFDVRDAFVIASINIAIENEPLQDKCSRDAIHFYNSVVSHVKFEESRLQLANTVLDYILNWTADDLNRNEGSVNSRFCDLFQNIRSLGDEIS